MPTHRFVAVAAILLIFPGLARAQEVAPAPAAAPTPDGNNPAPAAASDSATLAKNVLFETIVKLHLRPRVAARIDQKVDMLNQQFELKGSYYKDTGNRIRLQLNLEGAGDSGSTMLQVCDGKILWEYQQVLGMKNYRKREITPILKKLEESGLDDDFKALVISNLGFGGPEALLNGFQTTIAFNQFADETPTGIPDAVPSYKLGGTWANRSGLFGPGEREPGPTEPLPPYIPSNVQIYIDKATLWPYRIEMIGTKPSDIRIKDQREIDPATGRPIGVRKPLPNVTPSKITLLYTLLPETEIKPDEQFVFSTPRDASNLVDETDDFLQGLDRAIQMKQNEKKAKEAAGEGGDVMIKAAPIDVLAPPPAPIGPATPEPAPPK